jgi:hypothetical protein
VKWLSLFDPEDGGNMFFQKLSLLSPGYMALYLRRQNSSFKENILNKSCRYELKLPLPLYAMMSAQVISPVNIEFVSNILGTLSPSSGVDMVCSFQGTWYRPLTW